ncbi:MAG: DUF4432 family protein [Acidimicrobiia bacterium]|nr:DUF4432 family protein [Acidimicrobiia bacterium]
MNITAALESGVLPNIDAVLWARESVATTGAGSGMRVIDLHVWGGISMRVYPDRGLDIGQAWFGGVPLAWVSTVGETGPRNDLGGMAWGEAFGGGLMVTCGLRNVGMPSESHGLHGTYSHLAAQQVAVDRVLDAAGGRLEVKGVVTDDDGEAPLRHDRILRSFAGAGRIEIEDVTTNLGSVATPVPLLYHFNFGYPLWAGDAEFEASVASTRARDDESEPALESWRRPPVTETGAEWVLEHELGAGPAWAVIRNPALGTELTIRWDQESLPKLNQWIDRNPGMSVLGVEPANCTTRGRAFERAAGALPMLEPGEERRTRLSVEAQRI